MKLLTRGMVHRLAHLWKYAGKLFDLLPRLKAVRDYRRANGPQELRSRSKRLRFQDPLACLTSYSLTGEITHRLWCRAS